MSNLGVSTPVDSISMKKVILSYALVLLTISLTLLSCGEKKNASKSLRIKKLTKVISPKNGAQINLGIESIVFALQATQDTAKIDSFQVMHGVNLVYSSVQSQVVDSSALRKTGRQNFRITTFLDNGGKDVHNLTLVLMSNIEPKKYTYQKVNTFPHDPDAYTQGLFFLDGLLYENTGQNGYSSLRKVEINSGKLLQKYELPDDYFGEGITLLNDEIYMLTYTSRKGFVFDLETFEEIRQFDYPTQGWGITTIGDSLAMTDGSENIYYIDPVNFTETSRVQVYDQYRSVRNLNELEYVNGDIFANVYQTDEIVIIEPESGKIKGRIDLTGIFNQANYDRRLDVLNGIAYDKTGDRLFVTGKWWPKLYEIILISVEDSSS